MAACAAMTPTSRPSPTQATARIDGFAVVVPAGGAGTRLWPVSRAGSPKFLHDMTGAGRTLLQATWDRLAPLCGVEGVVLVTGAAHVEAVRTQLPDLGSRNLLAEPSGRDSMAAIGLAAAVLVRRDPDVVLGSFHADHVITGQDGFRAAVAEAVAVARTGKVVTIGIRPTHAATGFGYIRPGAALAVDGAPSALEVGEFVEKPDAATAKEYVESGYLWNAGFFVVRAQVLLDHLAQRLPELHSGLVQIAAALEADPDGASGAAAEVLDRVWPTLTRIAIDHAIAEPVAAAGGMAVVPGRFGWDDVGDWHSLAGLLPPGSPVVLGDPTDVVAIDAGGLVVPAGGRLVAVVGLRDVVVVDTPDALLVTTRQHAQQVKDVVGSLKESGRTDLL